MTFMHAWRRPGRTRTHAGVPSQGLAQRAACPFERCALRPVLCSGGIHTRLWLGSGGVGVLVAGVEKDGATPVSLVIDPPGVVLVPLRLVAFNVVQPHRLLLAPSSLRGLAAAWTGGVHGGDSKYARLDGGEAAALPRGTAQRQEAEEDAQPAGRRHRNRV
eukprot:CAMPEP_0195621630 /NCGR_PEP_ID=MMETSP0815-20121206/15785_1 /TAXON_ID=97485 /ORGANISM="Prymnesium parvum, Strain Texoma1" /LENGTH=160 /DNA_ID=CAMNT_0040762379 /DNA_START=441 /DNA_END=919 /DNA_ORIENTATION=-